MANFKIVITASDRATATVRKVKESISQFTKPIRQVRASVSALGREIGVDRMAKGLGRLAQGARAVAERAGKAVAAVAAIAGAASIAGVAALANQWGMLSLQISRAAAVIGIGTTQLQSLSRAAEAFGLDRGAMEAGLKSLGDTMEDALYGRNQDALMLMNRLGITMHKTKDGSVEAADGLYQVADAISKMKNVQAQGLVARTFGVEALLPFLQQGRKGIQAYEAQVKRTGAVLSGPALAQANAFARSLIGLKLAAQGTGNGIMAQLAPTIGPLVDRITAWTVANQGLIGVRVKEFVEGLVGPITTLVMWMGKAIEATIGWKGAGVALAVVLGARLAPAIWGLVKPIIAVVGWIGALAATALPGLALQAGVAASALGWEGLASAFVAIGAAIEATPVGWIITAIAAIGVAGYMMWKHWATIKDGFGKVWEAIPRLFLAGYRKLEPVIKALAQIPIFGVPFQAAQIAAGAMQGRQNAGAADPKVAAEAMKFYQGKGWTRTQAAGLVGNLAYESGFDTKRLGDGGAALGIAQWHADRQAAFKRWSGGKDLAAASLKDQLEFSQFELTKGGERKAGDLLRRQTTVAGAAAAVMGAYERPSTAAAFTSGGVRAGLAQRFYEAQEPAGGPGKPGQGAAPQVADAAGAGAKGAPPAPPVSHKLEITLKGLPKGTTAEVKSKTPGAEATARVDYAMPDLATL